MPRYRMFAALAAAGLVAGALASGAVANVIPGDKHVGTWVLVPMTGAAEVPGPGATSASGTATVQVDVYARKVCYALDAKGLDEITAAHLHKGAKGEQGAPVVTFKKALRGGAWDNCVEVDPALAEQILANPSGYYVNVHSAAFPAGALRAQLGS